MKVTKQSQFTGKFHTRELDITMEQWLRWDNGQGPHVQDCFPHLSADDREFILTGVTPEEWEAAFGDEEE